MSLDFEIDYLSKEYKLVKTVPALTDEMKETNTGNEPASSASAAINNISVDGTKDTPITSVSCDITLTNDKFKAITANTNVSSWFATGNLPAGLNANIVTAVAANAVQATIVISGTPTATSSAVISITIPAEHLASGKALTVTTNANAKFNISEPTAPAPSATISDFTIDGKVNEELAADKKITITLANDKFLPIERDGSDLSGWFAEGNLPNGLTAGLEVDVATDAVSLTIIISGTPTAASSAVISITIPAEHLASGKALTVTPNENTKFAITAS